MTIKDILLGPSAQRKTDLARRARTVDTEDTCAEPTVLVHGTDLSGELGDTGIYYQQCGGGRRILRKRISGN